MNKSIAAICVAAAALALSLGASSPAGAADPTTVTVSSSVVGSLSTQISTNNVWSGEIGQYTASKSNFAALALPLVRLHVGDDGGAPAMPEIKQNQWSFANLDSLVNDVTSTGQQPVMNIKFAPDWMWTCTTFQAAGQVRDQTFQTFAAYMARLVSYYNTGSMTTETGTVITNPKGTANHITYWELWNEPDLDNETPCEPASGQSLTPTQYVTMWNAVTAAMLAVDPTIKFIGPATAGGQFGSATGGAQNDYVTQLMANGNVKPYAISFHGYGYWDNTAPDKWIFDGDGTGGGCSCGGIVDMINAATAIGTTYPGYPMWITEVNVNADWGTDPNQRPSTALGAAWWGSMYSQLAPLNVALLHQYDVMDGPQFGLINDQNGSTFLPYWEVKTLNAAFPTGSSRLQVSSPDPQIQLLAAQRPDGKVSVLVVNRRLLNNTSKTGVGSPASLIVSLNGISPTAITLQQIDANTSASTGPATQTLDPNQPITLTFPGYGFALLTLTTGSSSPPPAPPTNTVAPTIDGTPQVGSTLTASPGSWTGSPTSYAYQWQRCGAGGCTAVAGATGSSYQPTADDVNDTLEVGVAASNGAGTSGTIWSSPTTTVTSAPAPTPPTATSAPSVTGSPVVGATLTVSKGAWSGTTPMTYGYAWERCASGGSCTAIAGATTSSYVATTGDVGSTIVAAVTATNSAGSATASSAPTAAVTDPPPATVGLDAFLGKRTANVTGTAMTLKTATAASAGARIVVGITWSSSATLGSVKGGGLAWTVDAQTVDSSGNHAALASAAAPSGLAAGTTLKAQFSAGVTYGLVFAASFTGIAPTNAVDGSGSNAQAASRAWSAGVTAAAGDLVVAWATIDAIAADTPTQPYEQVVRLANSSFWGSAAAVWGVASTDGSQSVSGTWGNKSGATGDATVAVAYRPAG